jgi:hypothetical protein
MAYDQTDYSTWLANNPNVMQQPTLQQQPVAQLPAATSYSAFLAPNASTQQPMGSTQTTEPQPSAYQKATPIVQAVTGGQRRQEAPIQMGQSTTDSSGMTQSDAPGVSATPMKPRINKIMQIIGAIFSMGATAAASKASQAGQQGGSNPPQGG